MPLFVRYLYKCRPGGEAGSKEMSYFNGFGLSTTLATLPREEEDCEDHSTRIGNVAALFPVDRHHCR